MLAAALSAHGTVNITRCGLSLAERRIQHK
jgi:hypothetical protein